MKELKDNSYFHCCNLFAFTLSEIESLSTKFLVKVEKVKIAAASYVKATYHMWTF